MPTVTDRFTLDANVLIYAVTQGDRRQSTAIDLLDRAQKERWTVTLQTLGEFFHAATRKQVIKRAEAAQMVSALLVSFTPCGPIADNVRVAVRQAADGRFAYWDAVMLATAADAGCTVCFSEDMGDGARLGAITVVNPFGPDGLSARALRLLSPTP